MEPIGVVRKKEKSKLQFLGELLEWYKFQEDPNSNWFLKVLYHHRHYNKLKSFISENSGERKVTYHL
jgi:hypothetical protein